MSHDEPAAGAMPAVVRIFEPQRNGYAEGVDLLRFSTAGSVDDGKSTLIGRLLYDTKSIFEDQLAALRAATRRRGEDGLNLALLTDGLRAEREQNITIDVAYRYFTTPKRKFIIADTPGHTQYTRNMVTGASLADLALILVDARKGPQTQSRRHAFISSLLGIPHFLVAVNKMDLVGYEEAAFRATVDAFREFACKLEIKDLQFVPISALHGDNVVDRSRQMAWYEGSTLLHHLESVNVKVDRNLVDFRFPVQAVLRPNQDFRGYAGRVASGVVRPGDDVVVLPARRATTVRAVRDAEGELAEAGAGESVVLTLDDDVDAGRGAMIARRQNLPMVGTRFDAMLCWMAETPLRADTAYWLMQTTRSLRAYVKAVLYRMDVETLHRQPAVGLGFNDIGRVEMQAAEPLCFDPFSRNRVTGSFILVDPESNATVAAGMIRGEPRGVEAEPGADAARVSPGAVWAPLNIGRRERERRNRHLGAVLWFTGLSGSGKSTIAGGLERRLFAQGCQTVLLDGDQLRHGLCGDLGFSAADRSENIRRVGEVARLFFEQGSIVLCTFVSPFRADRERVRDLVGPSRFLEIFVDCDLEECRRRDVKGLYKAARTGGIPNLTGVGQAYEPPPEPALRLGTASETPEISIGKVAALLLESGIVTTGASALD